jgi:hypothetical protein
MKKLFTYIKLKMVGLLWRRKKRSPSASSRPAELYLTTARLYLDLFERCLLRSDLSALIISGTPTLAQLSEAWANIYSEYIEKNQSNESKYIFQLQADIFFLTDEIDQVESGLELLSKMTLFHQADIDLIAGQLKKIGYSFPFDADDEDAYQNDLMVCSNRLASKKYKLQNREMELEQYLQNRKDDTIDENYFGNWIRRLTKYLGIRLQKHDTTVDDFLGYQKDYLDDIKRQKDEADSIKNKSKR